MKVPKPKVVKDPKYLAWVRTMPCYMRGYGAVACTPWTTIGKGPSEVSHLDTKSRDDRVLPMCGGHHRTNELSWHRGQKSFCAFFDTSKAELIREAEALYRTYVEAA